LSPFLNGLSSLSSTFAVCAAPAKRELLCCGKALFFKICFDFQLSARIYRLPPAKINLVQTASLMLKAGGENSHWGWPIFPLDKTEGVNLKHGIYSREFPSPLSVKNILYNCVFLLLSAHPPPPLQSSAHRQCVKCMDAFGKRKTSV
jgi:hypothetical protein